MIRRSEGLEIFSTNIQNSVFLTEDYRNFSKDRILLQYAVFDLEICESIECLKLLMTRVRLFLDFPHGLYLHRVGSAETCSFTRCQLVSSMDVALMFEYHMQISK